MTFDPDYVSAPGDTLRDWMAERGYDTDRVALEARLSAGQVAGILDGSYLITDVVAVKLGVLTGTTGMFWRQREDAYRRGLAAGKRRI